MFHLQSFEFSKKRLFNNRLQPAQRLRSPLAYAPLLKSLFSSNYYFVIFVTPPIYGTNASGIVTLPSASW